MYFRNVGNGFVGYLYTVMCIVESRRCWGNYTYRVIRKIINVSYPLNGNIRGGKYSRNILIRMGSFKRSGLVYTYKAKYKIYLILLYIDLAYFYYIG